MTITRNFKLCLNAGTQNAPYINVNQYDEGEQWIFDLYTEGGQKFTPSTGAIIGIKSDGNAILNSGTVNSDGQVVITETQQMTAASGRAIYELLIDNATHGTANFIVNVERRPSDDAEFSDSDLSMLQEAIDAAEVINEILDEGGDPSEIIAENVNNWLDNHPEVTTTVEDGAITAPKINQSLWDKLLVSESASGNPASFDDGADNVPVSSLKVALELIQLGSGDPSPSNVRPIYPANGKNMFDPSTLLSGYYADKDTNTLSGSTTNYRTAELALYQGTYTISFSNTVNIVRYREKGIVSSSNVATGVKSYTFTVSTNATVALGFRMPDVAWDDTTTIQIERGSSATPYIPYQGIMVDVKGRNLYPIAIGEDLFTNNVGGSHSNDNGTLIVTTGTGISSGVYSTGASTLRNISATYIGAITYSFKVKASGAVTVLIGYQHGGIKNVNATTDWQTVTISTTSIDAMSFIVYTNGTAATVYVKDFMFEVGSEAHDYVPYASTSYSMSLGRAVYGGTVDLTTGVLTVTHGIVTDFSALASNGTSSTGAYRYKLAVAGVAGFTIGEAKCNMLKFEAGLNDDAGEFYNGTDVFNIFLADSTVASAITTLTGCQIVYPLATPTTIQLTPQEVKTLLGYNNISSSGTVDVIYHADTKLYVDKMTAVDNNIIAPTEEGFTATRNYTVNDLVIVADTLYKVTANIASGSAITPNSNVTQTTLSALIKALS